MEENYFEIHIEKSRTWETSNLSTMRIVAPMPQSRVDQEYTKTNKKLKTEKIIQNRNNSKTSRDMPKLAIYTWTRGL